ncbi:MAG: murein biosynthesis integral membrane protein MurJ [Tissierellaceae bacterium]
MSKSKKAAKSIAIIIIFSFGGKLLGFIREMLIGAKFGSNAETDTYFLAMTAISLFTLVITKSINTTMIPVLAEIENKEGKEGKKTHTNNLLNIVIFIAIIIVILAWLLAPLIIKLLAPGFEDNQYKLAILLMRIGLPTIIFAGIQGVFRGYLQTEGSFTETAAISFPFNITYIIFLLFLSGTFGIKGLMVASVLAVVSQMFLQVSGLRRTNYRYKYILDFKDKYIRKILYLIPPILLSVGIGDLNKIIDKSMASVLVKGSISSLNYANRLDGLVRGVFIAAIATVMYPMLSQEANKGTYDGFKKALVKGINIILLITIPATVGMIILAGPIVKVAFQRGEFDSTATIMTAGALIFTLVGMVGSSLRTLLNNAYYSIQDTRTPVVNGIIAVAINVIFNFILIGSMGHRGLALATSISATVASLLLLHGLRKKIGSFGFLSSVRVGLKSLAASTIMGVVVYFLYDIISISIGTGILYELISLLVTVGIGSLIYLILIYLFKVDEVNWAIKLIKDKIRK